MDGSDGEYPGMSGDFMPRKMDNSLYGRRSSNAFFRLSSFGVVPWFVFLALSYEFAERISAYLPTIPGKLLFFGGFI